MEKEIIQNEPAPADKKKAAGAFSSVRVRLLFIVAAFISLIIIRLWAHAFGFSLGYLYLTLICLSGFWFGVVGGLTAALAASLIFIIEVNIFKDWLFRDYVVKSMFLRITFYFVGGITLAYISSVERKLRERLRILTYYDELTGCVNFRWVMQVLKNEVARCLRYNKEMALVMIDIDHFKQINDIYGHLEGNKVLRSFADVLKGTVRNVDVVGRYGGEEFLIVLPEANYNQALVVLERIKERVSDIKPPTASVKEKKEFSMRFSAGVASLPENGRGLEELIAAADAALYQAKKQGGDLVIMEKRRWVRVTPPEGVRTEIFRSSDEKRLNTAEMINVSGGGMMFLLPEDISTQEFLCKMYLPTEASPLELKCRLAHKEKTDKNSFIVGISFLDMPRAVEEKLLAYLNSWLKRA